ncbi:hypothetical protein SDJN03_11873, partial [Cucurbita argyrosperma subsp. sororia]
MYALATLNTRLSSLSRLMKSRIGLALSLIGKGLCHSDGSSVWFEKKSIYSKHRRGLEYPLNSVLLLKREVEASIVVYSVLPGLPKPLAAEKLLK